MFCSLSCYLKTPRLRICNLLVQNFISYMSQLTIAQLSSKILVSDSGIRSLKNILNINFIRIYDLIFKVYFLISHAIVTNHHKFGCLNNTILFSKFCGLEFCNECLWMSGWLLGLLGRIYSKHLFNYRQLLSPFITLHHLSL